MSSPGHKFDYIYGLSCLQIPRCDKKKEFSFSVNNINICLGNAKSSWVFLFQQFWVNSISWLMQKVMSGFISWKRNRRTSQCTWSRKGTTQCIMISFLMKIIKYNWLKLYLPVSLLFNGIASISNSGSKKSYNLEMMVRSWRASR